MPHHRSQPMDAVRPKRKRNTTVRKVQKKTTSARKDKQRGTSAERAQRPNWLGKLLMATVVLGLVVGFYFFFIRPYAYRWRIYDLTTFTESPLRRQYSVHGFDISHHQGEIQWGELKNAINATDTPLKFVFIKATEGGDFKDTRFEENFEQARLHGFIRGAYHFYRPMTSPEAQAQSFIQSVKLEAGDLPPVLDIEIIPEDKEQMRRDLLVWLRTVEAHYGVKPIIYTYHKYKENWLSGREFDLYPFWIAHYYVAKVRYQGSWDFWQHSDMGKLPGIQRTVDLNVFNGTLEQLKQMAIRPHGATDSTVQQTQTTH